MRTRNFRCVAVIFLMIVIIQSCFAIQISEVELNPTGTDKGNEWIEFFSEDEINLEDYIIVNNDGDKLNLSGSFSRYYIYDFEKQWLDNSDEKVFLYKDDELISETDLLEDSGNDGKTWSDCDGKWIFGEGSKGEKNFCEVEDSQEEIEIEEIKEIIEDEVEEIEEVEEIPDIENSQDNIIYLTPKSIKTEESEILYKSGNEKIKQSAIYGFALFCVLIIILLLIERKR